MLFNRTYRVHAIVKRNRCDWEKVIDVIAQNKKAAIEIARAKWYGDDPWNKPHLFHVEAGRIDTVECPRWTTIY